MSYSNKKLNTVRIYPKMVMQQVPIFFISSIHVYMHAQGCTHNHTTLTCKRIDTARGTHASWARTYPPTLTRSSESPGDQGVLLQTDWGLRTLQCCHSN